jgi:hypothetical protein
LIEGLGYGTNPDNEAAFWNHIPEKRIANANAIDLHGTAWQLFSRKSRADMGNDLLGLLCRKAFRKGFDIAFGSPGNANLASPSEGSGIDRSLHFSAFTGQGSQFHTKHDCKRNRHGGDGADQRDVTPLSAFLSLQSQIHSCTPEGQDSWSRLQTG